MSLQRLDKFLSNAGCGTRSQVRSLLKKGLVTVNGIPAEKPEQKIDDERDRICCRNLPVQLEKYRYYMMNKPAGVLSATQDSRQPVVVDLIRENKSKDLFPVGRLDIDTEGLLLLTNDGELAHQLLSPKKHVNKTYFARVRGKVTEEDRLRFSEGLDIGEKKETMPAQLVLQGYLTERAEDGKEEIFSETLVTIQEGKFHQIKRMFEKVGKKVIYLKRLSMGSLLLDETLQPGEYRCLTNEEIEGLKNHAGKEKSRHL